MNKHKRVGRALKAAARNHGMGHTALSQILGVARCNIFEYEIGARPIPKEILTTLFNNALKQMRN